MNKKHWQQDSLPAQNTVAVLATDTAVVPRSENRVNLILCSSPTQAITWSIAAKAVYGQGVNMAAGQFPIVFTANDNGSLVNAAWRTATAGATDNLTFIEVINSCPCD